MDGRLVAHTFNFMLQRVEFQSRAKESASLLLKKCPFKTYIRRNRLERKKERKKVVKYCLARALKLLRKGLTRSLAKSAAKFALGKSNPLPYTKNAFTCKFSTVTFLDCFSGID